jgi:5-methylcytosine-specific restriction endonuclease McrA
MDFYFDDVDDFVKFLKEMHGRRESEKSVEKGKARKRRSLKLNERELVLSKTGGRCHICGGLVGDRWHADHILAHSAGGVNSADNYLAAHPVCNNYRWDYLPEEFQLILKLGVWARTEIEKGTKMGKELSKKFLQKEKQRVGRRKSASVV